MDRPLARSIAQAPSAGKHRGGRRPGFRTRHAALGLAFAAVLFAPDSRADDAFLPVRFSADRLVYGEHAVEAVRLELAPDGAFHIEFATPDASGGAAAAKGLVFQGGLDRFRLESGALQGEGTLRYEGLAGNWRVRSEEDGLSACLSAAAQPLEQAVERGILPPQAAWLTGGDFSACVDYRQDGEAAGQARLDVATTGLSFDSPDGRFAAVGLGFGLRTEIDVADTETMVVEGELETGEILLDNLYADFSRSPVTFSLRPRWSDGALAGLLLSAKDEDAFVLDAGFAWPRDGAGGHWTVNVGRLELEFPGAYRDYLEPLAAAWSLDGLEVTGGASWSGALSDEGLDSGDLTFRDLSVVDTRRGRFALTGLDVSLRPGDYRDASPLSWRGLLLGRINLGAGAALLDPEPGAFALLDPLELSVLGGSVRLEHLKYVLPGQPPGQAGDSRFEMRANIDDVDMRELTAAFGWPSFSGRLSGELPGARLADGVLTVDGEIRIDVFDGHVIVRELEAERLFGVLPSLSADIAIDDLDLERLTETFEFGYIGGRVDGYVNGLRMLDWQPVAFDAWLGTPTEQGRSHTISRKAVNHLTRIGGGGATAALSGPLLRMFSNFSYRRIGLGCRLQNYVCEVRGIGEDGESVQLMEGSGIPKITVRAWNRQVDWPQMVANLTAVAGGESMQIGEAPEP